MIKFVTKDLVEVKPLLDTKIDIENLLRSLLNNRMNVGSTCVKNITAQLRLGYSTREMELSYTINTMN